MCRVVQAFLAFSHVFVFGFGLLLLLLLLLPDWIRNGKRPRTRLFSCASPLNVLPVPPNILECRGTFEKETFSVQ